MRMSFVALFVLGCNQATLLELPDANDGGECVSHAVPFCDATAPPSGCMGAEDAAPDSYASLLPTDAAFPVGCTANVIATQRDPVTGICKLAAVCTCSVDDAGDASPQWSCSP